MVALGWERPPLPHGAAALRLLVVAVLATVWLGLNYRLPEVGAAIDNIGVVHIAVHLAILYGLWLGLGRIDLTADARVRVWLAIAIPLTFWLAGIWAVSLAGVFRPVPGQPVLPILPVAILVPPIIATTLLMRSARIAALLDAMPASWLIGLQVYRLLGGLFLINWMRGLMPGVFALPAGSGDTLVGLLALPAALYVATVSRLGRRIGVAWNVLGLLDLTIAIAMGMMSSLGPFQVLTLDRPNTLVGTYPTVMVPAFTVPSSIVLHILSLWQLRRQGRSAQ